MKYKKLKISLLALGIIALISATLTNKPKNFTRTSPSGKVIDCERGKIKVPQIRPSEDGKTFDVKYVRLKSFTEQPKAPIFFLAGGPGNGCFYQAEHPYYLENWSKYLEERDVILINQRGVRKWWHYWMNFKNPPQSVFVTAEGYRNYYDEIYKKALKTFNRRGVNLNAYNTIENAYDIDDLRNALGYDKIVLLAFSYGTHLAQAYMKYHGENVDKAILAGVEGLQETFKLPLEMDRQFDDISELVKQDTILSKHIPDLHQLYDSVVLKLTKSPITLDVKSPFKTNRKLTIGKYGLDYILRRDMGDLADIPTLPKLLYTINNGDYSLLQWFAQKRYNELLFIPAMTLSMDIASGASEQRLKEIKNQESESRFGNITNAPFLDLLGKWPIQDLGDSFREPVTSDVPTLFLSGSLDLNTPPHQAERAKKGFKNATHIIVENAGHEQILTERNMTETIIKFLDNQDVSEVKLSYGKVRFVPL